ncbi:MAG: hypothetical protein IAE79_21325 [Anaerolinea sp.]|nr:hypothetical protein [Anaerolinea sp.]
MTLKIAFPTDDGETISRHFGKAAFFQVVTLADGNSPTTELRAPSAPEHAPGESHEHAHAHKFDLLQDCDVLIGAGMGESAHARLQSMGITIFLTGAKTIVDALQQYEAGTLTSDMRRVHAHHHHDHEHHEHQAQPIRFVDERPSP